MCGIMGYVGTKPAAPRLLEGLSRLEYRGYDSAGIALAGEREVRVFRCAGKVAELADLVAAQGMGTETAGIGHTRWATHGPVTEGNAHPHRAGHVTLVHNGIIENYAALEQEMAALGRKPLSQTDTEIAAMVLDAAYGGDPVTAIRRMMEKLEGSYAMAILFDDKPGTLYAVRRGSPLVVSGNEEGTWIASDITPLLAHVRRYFVPEEGQILIATATGTVLVDAAGSVAAPRWLPIDWDDASAQKDGYPHFMLKEIMEQPQALWKTLQPRLGEDGCVSFSGDGIPSAFFRKCRRVIITACGTAMHAGLLGKIAMERMARIPVTVEIASEFRYAGPILDADTLVIVISQSGETADSLAALRLAKEKGARTLSVVNCKGSSIARESQYVLYTHAGPEIAVASTKAFSVQILALYMIADQLALGRGDYGPAQRLAWAQSLRRAEALAARTLRLAPQIKEAARELKDAENLFYIGRGMDSAMASEGSLKLKEISYIHSEAYPAGELKHGAISLVTFRVPVVAIATQESVRVKMLSNIREVRARGARVLLITREGWQPEEGLCCQVMSLPAEEDTLAPFSVAVALQLLAYYTAVERGLPVDQPRNLAKSVTVE